MQLITSTLIICLFWLLTGCSNQSGLSEDQTNRASSEVIFADNWESGCWNAEKISGDSMGSCETAKAWKQSQMQGSFSGKVVSDIIGQGKYAMRFEWKNEGDCPSNSHKKAHLNAFNVPNPLKPHHVSLMVYFPSAGMEADSEPEIIAQWHGEPNDETCEEGMPRWHGCGPFLWLKTQNGRLSLGWKGSPKACLDCRSKKENRYEDTIGGSEDLGEIEKDKWITYRFFVEPDFNGNGSLKLWKDDELKVEKSGIHLGYNDQKGGYPCIGIYKYTCRSDHQRRVIYFDDFQIKQEDSRTNNI